MNWSRLGWRTRAAMVISRMKRSRLCREIIKWWRHLAATRVPRNIATFTTAQPPLPNSSSVSWISSLRTTQKDCSSSCLASASWTLASASCTLPSASWALPSASRTLPSTSRALLPSSCLRRSVSASWVSSSLTLTSDACTLLLASTLPLSASWALCSASCLLPSVSSFPLTASWALCSAPSLSLSASCLPVSASSDVFSASCALCSNTMILSRRIRDSGDVSPTLLSPSMSAVVLSMLVGVLYCPIFLSFSLSLSGDPNCSLVPTPTRTHSRLTPPGDGTSTDSSSREGKKLTQLTLPSTCVDSFTQPLNPCLPPSMLFFLQMKTGEGSPIHA